MFSAVRRSQSVPRCGECELWINCRNMGEREARDLEDWKELVAQPLERVNVRTRASQVTLSAWRLEASSPAGRGSIVLLEPPAEESIYRGEGIFLGWTQQQLARAYQALAPKSDEPAPDLPQLG